MSLPFNEHFNCLSVGIVPHK